MVHLLSSAISEAIPHLPCFIRSRMPLWLEHSPAVFLDFLEQLKLSSECPPDVPHIVDMIKTHAGFSLLSVTSSISLDRYLVLLHQNTFPVATRLRSSQHDDFSLFPDMIHDLFCHVPWLLNQDIVNFFKNMGKLLIKAVQRARALYPIQEDYVRVYHSNVMAMERLCWFTVESGLIEEKGRNKVYGAAILSSTRELSHVFKSKSFISPRNLELIIHRPFHPLASQSTFFLIHDFYELYEISELMHFFLEQGRLDSITLSSHTTYDPNERSVHELYCL